MPPETSDSRRGDLRVAARLALGRGNLYTIVGEPLDVTVGTNRAGDEVALTIAIERGSTWTLRFEPAAAAFLAAGMAVDSGVRFG